MNNDYCDITLILDKSGSMGPLQKDTIGGVNRFLSDQRRLPGKCLISIVQFDTTYTSVYLGRPIADASDLTEATYQPGGSTALLDAVGWTIDEVGSRIKAISEQERPGKALIVIVTDGEENSSHQRSKDQVKQAIERQQKQYKWEFVFMGANVDAFAEAGGLGIFAANAFQTHPTQDSVMHAYANLSSNAAAYRGGTAQTMAWSGKQQDEQNKTK